jgi:hypothetical protein
MPTPQTKRILALSEFIATTALESPLDGRHQCAALAVALGRLCEHHGVEVGQATILAKVVGESGNPLPPLEKKPR